MTDVPNITRVRHELRLRRATVAKVETIAPQIKRITLQSEELRGFTSLGFDDHVKLFFPTADGRLNLSLPGTEGAGEKIMRDFTPRRFDAEKGELVIDFFIHEDGPATTWAVNAGPGSVLGVGGPRGSSIISTDGIGLHLLIGDETALPAIARRLEELPANTCAMVVAEVAPGFELHMSSRANLQIVWVPRNQSAQAGAGEGLIGALNDLPIVKEGCFAWAATETQAARAIRRYLMEKRGFDKRWVKAAGYWQRGAVGSHVVVED
ncbi:siderophore-interacting protein [Steroidobacter sp. S1-65]|uniref:Siderophore-interacting protein n=1 Tax=Steroidobacter gossypii TaxID=2805490 RepID=A0ABS1WY23_9GAMM|nr:siderophore-interacting protein [Steroidobacter gossypii]MBM0105866.1 siderophore-interacting protein [Steroidobacter gossypii]